MDSMMNVCGSMETQMFGRCSQICLISSLWRRLWKEKYASPVKLITLLLSPWLLTSLLSARHFCAYLPAYFQLVIFVHKVFKYFQTAPRSRILLFCFRFSAFMVVYLPLWTPWTISEHWIDSRRWAHSHGWPYMTLHLIHFWDARRQIYMVHCSQFKQVTFHNCRCLTRVQCATCYGLTPMTEQGGASPHVEQDIPLARTAQKSSTTRMASNSLPELINLSWRATIGPRHAKIHPTPHITSILCSAQTSLSCAV